MTNKFLVLNFDCAMIFLFDHRDYVQNFIFYECRWFMKPLVGKHVSCKENRNDMIDAIFISIYIAGGSFASILDE